MLSTVPSVFEDIQLEEFRYQLPEERIAKHPLPQREQSKLLLYKKGTIHHHHFFELPRLLPQESLLVFNNTKVIPARLQFKKETGAHIEIFLLQPITPTSELQLAMAATETCSWGCMIGNRKRWRPEQLLHQELTIGGKTVLLTARQASAGSAEVVFEWNSTTVTFAELVEAAGEIPLPPYLKRTTEEADKERYQTVYSSQKGAVAAPTAGLHFTPALLQQLQQQGTQLDQLTLHVGAGTFQPIKESNLARHQMHREQLVVTEENILKLLQHQGTTIAIGTTSMRTLESIFWYGAKLLNDPEAPFFISKEECYTYLPAATPTKEMALKAVLKKLQLTPGKALTGETEIFIVPGYHFQLCRGLITNFHQPESTLMLLVAAFIGADWKSVYHEALSGNYRFLSYGDSSLLLPDFTTKQ